MAPIRCANSASAARSFVQLAKRQHYTTSASPTAPLDFLVPNRGAANSSRLRYSKPSPRFYTPTATSPILRQTLSQPVRRRNAPPTRGFAASAAQLSTRCVQNPLKDEDGNEMMLDITPRAAKRLSDIMAKDKNPNLALRIQVESGGCHGFQYLMSLITIPAKDAQEWSSVVSEDDSIFQYVADEAESGAAAQPSPRVILDEPSLDLLKGSKVDFTMELIGSQFKIVDNPYASSSCGCGTSFDIKM